MKNTPPVILFGDWIASFGAIRGLRKENIPVHVVASQEDSLPARCSYVFAESVIPENDPLFHEKVTEICNRYEKCVLIVAGSDDYLLQLSKIKNKLPASALCSFPDYATVQLVYEKEKTYAACAQVGVGYPLSVTGEKAEDICEQIREKGISWPILLKARDSKRFYEKFNVKCIITHDFKDIEEACSEYGDFLGKIIASEYIEGNNSSLHNCIAVCDGNGDCVEIFQNRKVHTVGPNLGCTLMENYYSPEVEEQSRKLLKHIGYIGYANPEFKYDFRDGKIKLMEINGRISISNSHALLSGLNPVAAMYHTALGHDVPFRSNKGENGRTLWWLPLSDIKNVLLPSIKNKKFFETIRHYRHSRIICEPFSIHEKRVAIRMVLNLISKSFKKAFRMGKTQNG